MLRLSHKDGGQDGFWACSDCLRTMVNSKAYGRAWFPQKVLTEGKAYCKGVLMFFFSHLVPVSFSC